MRPRTRRALAVALVVGVALLGLLAAPEAWARVGGGQSFGGGGSSGGSSGGGGSADGDLIWFLIWLCLEHPAIGIPVTLVVVGVAFAKHFANERRRKRQWRPEGEAVVRRPQRRRASGLAALKEVDPGFSEPLLLDFAQLVYARAQALRGRGDREALGALLAPPAISRLLADAAGLEAVEEVIFGATRVREVQVGARWTSVVIGFTTNLTEVRGGRRLQLLREERWTLRRAAGVHSPGPERMRSLGCVGCGSTLEPGTDGRCPNCDRPRTGGALQWEVVAPEVVASRPLTRPELHPGGGVEPGTRGPTVRPPDLPARRRAFEARHPGFDWKAFKARVAFLFGELQQAWSDQSWERARPYETDPLYQVHRFWMERYRRFGLVNRLEDVEILKMELANLDLDPWLESMTVRVWARMRDWTEEVDSGEVVGGSKTQPRTFSEYWTFIRAIGAEDRGAGPKDGRHCPSCGAPLDRVGAAGVCGYCDTKITGGDYDWVLSRIEQDETYGR